MTTNPPPHIRRLSAAEFMRMAEAGTFGSARVELVGGEVVPVAAQSNWHSTVIEETTDLLRAAFGPDFYVRAQYSLDLSPHSVVDPDIAVIPGNKRLHRRRAQPTTAVLIVEASETTLADDRRTKAGLYASVGVPEFWILDIVHRRLEVRRDPRPDQAAEFGASYAAPTLFEMADFVSPLSLPGVRLSVAAMMPLEEGEK